MANLIKGSVFVDERGSIKYNNKFNMDLVKRIYVISNSDKNFVRAWQGHKIEKRWFSAVKGDFIIKVIKIDNWENPSKNIVAEVFKLSSSLLDILEVESGHVTSIQSLKDDGQLLVFADYEFNEIKDEYRYEKKYFNEE